MCDYHLSMTRESVQKAHLATAAVTNGDGDHLYTRSRRRDIRHKPGRVLLNYTVCPTPGRVLVCAGFQHMLWTARIMALFTPHYPVNK